MVPAELGVGITYSTVLEPLVLQNPELINVVEIEPQTLWSVEPGEEKSYWIDDRVLDRIARLPASKLIHSVGTPVGGSVRPDPSQFDLLRESIDRFAAPWASDHLSFNSVQEFYTGFFLPPRQTKQGVQLVVQSIQELQSALRVPFAVETGVNYLRPRPDEMDDGRFISEVVETASCGLLLDLHNVFANSVNGRQPLEEFIEQIPLERVWEIHIAGGMEMDDFWLDSHSGPIPELLVEFTRTIVPRLPNLGAIIFEILPVYIPMVGFETIKKQLEILQELWALRKSAPEALSFPTFAQKEISVSNYDSISPEVWENTLGKLVIGWEPEAGEVDVESLSADPGIIMYQRLIKEFRASMIVRVLRLTSRLIFLTIGVDSFRHVLKDFWRENSPQQYSYLEAKAFAAYIRSTNLDIPYLPKVLEFEWAAINTLMDEKKREIEFDFNPLPLFEALFDKRLPESAPESGDFAIEITSDGPESATGIDLNDVRQVFPFH